MSLHPQLFNLSLLGSQLATDLYDNYYAKKPSLKLYVRRVFISDSFEELLPKVGGVSPAGCHLCTDVANSLSDGRCATCHRE